MTTVLQGPFLTRAEAAARAGIGADSVSHRPDLLRLDGQWLEEVYFAFQFAGGGIRRDIGEIVLHLRGRCDDATIAGWLCCPNSDLGGACPLAWLQSGGSVRSAIDASDHAGPPERQQSIPAPTPQLVGEVRESTKRRWGRAPLAHGH